MATVNIGSLKFNWKGAYNGSTAYAIDDVTEYNGSSYICILASTGNLPTNTTYFQPMATKGTDGTDVGTTLTTQGDILYRDGSGLQRLGAGTSGQVLQTNGTGANPSWNTVSSDFVKISQVTPSSVTAVNFNNVFTTGTYASYKIVGSQIMMNSANWIKFRWRNSGADYTSSNYYWATDGVYGTSGAQSSQIYKGWGTDYMPVNYWSQSSSAVTNFTIDVGNPASGTGFKSINASASFHSNGSEQFQNDTAGMVNQTNTFDGCTIFTSSSANFTSGSITIYGLK